MCGRYVSATSSSQLADYFGVNAVGEALVEPNYNIAPSTPVPVVVTKGDERRLELFRWGLIPFWAKSASIGNKMINARIETLTEKSPFKRALARHRCIVPADAFYEWTTVTVPGHKKPMKQPWCIRRTDEAPFAFAGLYASWTDPANPEGPRVLSCTIITGPANDAIRPIHDRMPVMLAPGTWHRWLDPADEDGADILAALPVPPTDLFSIYPVSTAVNNANATGPSLLDRVELAPAQPTLL